MTTRRPVDNGGLSISTDDASAPIPVALVFDIEPDEVFVDGRRDAPMLGMQFAEEKIDSLRAQIENATGRTAAFTWHVRTDLQIEGCYGTRGAYLDRYDRSLRRWEGQGDEIGMHLHTYRGLGTGKNWLCEFEDQQWINDCIDASLESFRRYDPRGAETFSFGAHWLNEATFRHLEQAGIGYDATLRPGIGVYPMKTLYPDVGEFNGYTPDTTNMPTRPYLPQAGNFLAADPAREAGTWIVPVTVLPWGFRKPTRQRLSGLVSRIRGRRTNILRPFALRYGRPQILPVVDYLVAHERQPYFLFELRTAVFARPDIWERISDGVACMLEHPAADRLRFTTIPETVALLDPQGGTVQQRRAG